MSFVFVGIVIKLSVLDISSFSSKFNDTHWLKFTWVALDGQFPGIVLWNVSDFQIDRSSSALRRPNETNSLIAVWCNIRSLTLIPEFLRISWILGPVRREKRYVLAQHPVISFRDRLSSVLFELVSIARERDLLIARAVFSNRTRRR